MRWKAFAEIYTMHSFALLENQMGLARVLIESGRHEVLPDSNAACEVKKEPPDDSARPETPAAAESEAPVTQVAVNPRLRSEEGVGGMLTAHLSE